ncbi:hypothetical protein [Streptomyces sp. NPDC087300]|uniref:hypothetical protein n=1 Tax=Streptomyces sp. NPDC087300 TaxID=3365780 RepID=UPI0037F1877B
MAVTGRVLCDEAVCHDAATRHHFDAAEEVEARAAAHWVAQKERRAAGEFDVALKPLRAGRDRRQRRTTLLLIMAGWLCMAAGAGMSQYDYHRPEFVRGTGIAVWIGENADAVCNHLALPAVVVGGLLTLVGFGRFASTPSGRATRSS